MSSQNTDCQKFTQEEWEAIQLLAKHNKVVYVNKNTTGLGTLYLNNALMHQLISMDLIAKTNTDRINFMQIKVEVNPASFNMR